jgi:hypothetical protein
MGAVDVPGDFDVVPPAQPGPLPLVQPANAPPQEITMPIKRLFTLFIYFCYAVIFIR